MTVAYPFTAIVGQDDMKLALSIAAVDPSIGGVLVFGERGTGKSTTIRALAQLLPKIDAVKDCPYNCNPEAPNRAYAADASRRMRSRHEKLPSPLLISPWVQPKIECLARWTLKRPFTTVRRHFNPVC